MHKYYVTYKGRILVGPLPEADAEQKRIKLGYCFKNVRVVREDRLKRKPQRADEGGSGGAKAKDVRDAACGE